MQIIVVGCGRLGTVLASNADANGHRVAVIDELSRAFESLPSSFQGRTITGNPLDREVLERASIGTAGGLAAVTPHDNVNLVVASMGTRIFKVPQVVARVMDSARLPSFDVLGIQALSASSWGAERIEWLVSRPGMVPLGEVWDRDVELIEITVPQSLAGRRVEDLGPGIVVSALRRAGETLLCSPQTELRAGDQAVVCVRREQIGHLEAMLARQEGA